MPPLVPIGSADFRGWGKFRRKTNYQKQRRKASIAFSPSTLTNAGCNYLGSYTSPPCAPSLPCEFPSASVGPPCGPRPRKRSKKEHPSCTLPCMPPTSPGLSENSAGNMFKRALEATGGDGRTPKIKKDLRAHVRDHASVSPCVRGKGLCPTTGWTIDQYCPACHG